MDKPIGLSELLKILFQYEKMYGNIPIRYITDNGEICDICTIDLASIVLKDKDTGEQAGYNLFINLRNKFDYSTLKKKEEEVENEDQ